MFDAFTFRAASWTENEEDRTANESGVQGQTQRALSVCWLGDLALAFGAKPAKADYKIA